MLKNSRDAGWRLEGQFLDRCPAVEAVAQILNDCRSGLPAQQDGGLCSAKLEAKTVRHLEAVNDLCLLKRTPCLYGNSDGSALDIGPLVQPFETGCFACLELRRRSARELAFESAFYEERLAIEHAATERMFVGEAIWPDTLGASLIVGEACRFITGIAPPQLTEKMLRVLPVSGTMEENRFSRVPRCPACYRGVIPAAELAR